jgi:quercetin dioxygenase-like cupin family protein
MTDIQNLEPSVTELPAYRGQGVRGWRVEIGEGGRTVECVDIEAGQPFGGEWPEPQVWKILSGIGQLSWEGGPGRIRVRAGDARHFDAGHRHLLIAETPMRLLIAPVP